jgi:uncharacterized protein (TIGR04255 family)
VPKVPARLERDPILEAVFEFRFQGAVPAVAEVLQGAMYPKLRDRFSKVQRTPFSQFGGLLDDPALRYQPRLVLQGDNLRVHIGDRAIALVCVKPYVGWKAFRPLILELVDLVKTAKVVKESERISLKYINLLEGQSPAQQFSLVHYNASLGRGQYRLSDYLTYTRTEIEKDGLINIVELGANSVAQTPSGPVKGLILSVDSICNAPPDFLSNPEPHVEKVHNVEKNVFFDVLTEETINAMGPKWE